MFEKMFEKVFFVPCIPPSPLNHFNPHKAGCLVFGILWNINGVVTDRLYENYFKIQWQTNEIALSTFTIEFSQYYKTIHQVNPTCDKVTWLCQGFNKLHCGDINILCKGFLITCKRHKFVVLTSSHPQIVSNIPESYRGIRKRSLRIWCNYN